jgi:hypothetical protein
MATQEQIENQVTRLTYTAIMHRVRLYLIMACLYTLTGIVAYFINLRAIVHPTAFLTIGIGLAIFLILSGNLAFSINRRSTAWKTR